MLLTARVLGIGGGGQANSAKASCKQNFFHFDIVITISAIVNPLFEHGGAGNVGALTAKLFLFLYFYDF